ncbi:hypothetical protein [Myxococcus sp. CA039A]|uniref:hypothetical protein n=1 Tax=Myxococcus sp. CA039A TaxID=2741737 RepID=UPI00157AD7EE|nr:hypothetical protein [Myxococcus sp. CA039A]NTX52404.1 hypothetical protein [Myxococcus sp. CA039A]
MRQQAILRVVVGSASLCLGGWSEAAWAGGPAQGPVGVLAEPASGAARPRTLDDALLEVEREVPGFGGMYHDEKGRLVVRLVNATAAPAARRAIASVFGAERIPQAGVVTQPATRTFSQLKALQERLTPDVLALPGTVFTDVDEKSNRVAIGVEKAEARAIVERAIARLAVARDAVDIVEWGPINPTSVQSGWTPVGGGLQIETPGKYCTLGFPALQGGTLGFVSNSHCTQVQGGVESTPAYQAVAPWLVGTETTDPGYASGGSCPAGRICRSSDSAFFRGEAAIATYVVQTPGAFDLNISAWPEVTGKVLYPSQGQTVFKTGRTTGTTSGTIQWACATVNSGGTPHTYYCNYIATSATQNGAGGDSGSPVYFLNGNGVTLTGLMWGAGASPWNFAFSPLGGVQAELGVVPYCQGGVGC